LGIPQVPSCVLPSPFSIHHILMLFFLVRCVPMEGCKGAFPLICSGILPSFWFASYSFVSRLLPSAITRYHVVWLPCPPHVHTGSCDLERDTQYTLLFLWQHYLNGKSLPLTHDQCVPHFSIILFLHFPLTHTPLTDSLWCDVPPRILLLFPLGLCRPATLHQPTSFTL